MTARGPAAAVLLAGALLAPSPAAADEVDDAIASFQERVAPPAGPDAKERAIAELGVKHDPRVAAVLRPLLQDTDRAVRVQAAKFIGEQKDPKIAPLLESMATREIKKKDTDEIFLAALVEGVGDADPKGRFEFLVEIARKWLDQDARVTIAAAEGYAQTGTREAVDELVKLLAVADVITTGQNAVAQKTRDEVRKALVPILKRATGKDIGEAKVWKSWWDDNKKSWKPPGEGAKPDAAAAGDPLVFTDDAYGWSIRRPSQTWAFEKVKGAPLRIQASVDGSAAAWVVVISTELSNYKEKNAEQVAEAIRRLIEPDFTDCVKERTDWNKPGKWKGLPSVTQEVFGRHKDLGTVALKNVFATRGTLLFRIETTWKSGSPQYLRDDIEKMLDSFRISK